VSKYGYLTILGLAAGGPGEAEVPGHQQQEGDSGAGGEADLRPGRQDQGRGQPLQEAVLNTSHCFGLFIIIQCVPFLCKESLIGKAGCVIIGLGL
jgi:hypothetical protein